MKNISGNLTLSDDDDSSSESSYDGNGLEMQDATSNSEKAPEQSEFNYVVDVGSAPIGTWEQHTKVCVIFISTFQ